MTLDDLEALAKAATPGPWTAFATGCIWSDDGDAVVSAGDDGKPYGMHSAVLEIEPRDAAYIAAASPDAILDLIRRVREAERERDAALAKLAEAEAAHDLEKRAHELTWNTKRDIIARVREVEAERDAARASFLECARAVGLVHQQSMGPDIPGDASEVASIIRGCVAAADELSNIRWCEQNAPREPDERIRRARPLDAPPSDGGARQMDEAIARREASIAELETHMEGAERREKALEERNAALGDAAEVFGVLYPERWFDVPKHARDLRARAEAAEAKLARVREAYENERGLRAGEVADAVLAILGGE